jgi:hypothetical protein
MKSSRTATVFILKNFLQLKSASARLLLALVLFFAVAANTQTNGLSDAEIKGRELAQKLRDAWPEENLTNTGTLQIRDGKGVKTEYPLLTKTIVGGTNWLHYCQITFTNHPNHLLGEGVLIKHFGGQKTIYETFELSPLGATGGGANILEPFAGSDFSVGDLGLEFFHWPQQKVLPSPTRLKRGRAYTLLESTNPNPPTNGYSRVLSWIDQETGGILEAEAYDAQGKLLKDFAPKEFKKVNGQWELQEMEIRNVQTGSRTRLEFDLKKSE